MTTAMNTASAIYPNTYFRIQLEKESVFLFWDKESDEVAIFNTNRLDQQTKVETVPNPSLIHFVPNPNMTPRSDATYSVSKENSQIKLKYLDGHRFKSVVVQPEVA